jgi:hypothetical protein
MAAPNQFGGLILDLRKMRGWTQADVVRNMPAPMDPTHMGTYENAKTIPNLTRALEILAAHGYVLMAVPREDVEDDAQVE